MEMKLRGSGPALTESELTNTERAIGRSIPAEYREFLLRHNGGTPTPSTFEFGSDGEAADLKVFLGIGMAENTFDISYTLQIFGNELPKNFFPVARDPGGSLVGILIKQNGESPVMYWDHESSSSEISSLSSIADGFAEFIRMIEKNE